MRSAVEFWRAGTRGSREDGGIQRGANPVRRGPRRAAYEWTVKQVVERKAFGKPVGSFQNSKFVLAEIATELDVADAYVDNIVKAYNQGPLTAGTPLKPDGGHQNCRRVSWTAAMLRTSAIRIQILSAGAKMVTVAEPCIGTAPPLSDRRQCHCRPAAPRVTGSDGIHPETGLRRTSRSVPQRIPLRSPAPRPARAP
jgi:hypothetical protein